MKVDIVRQTDNKSLQRKELEFRIEHIGGTTPSRTDVKAKIVAQFDSAPDCVVVVELDTKYGIGLTLGKARIYSSPEQLRFVEDSFILKRHEPKKKAGAE